MSDRKLYCIVLGWETEDVTDEYVEVVGPFIGKERAAVACNDYTDEPGILSARVVGFGWARTWAGAK